MLSSFGTWGTVKMELQCLSSIEIPDSWKFFVVVFHLGGGFKYFFMFTPTWGNDPIWLIFPQAVYCWGSQCCLKCVLSPSLFPKQFTVGVLNAVLSVSALAGVLCPPRWACLPICLPSGFVFQLGSGAVSASLGLSPNLSPSVLSPLVSRLALSFTLAGVLCPPRWACLRSCLPPCLPSGLGCCVRLAGLVFLLSAVLSPVLSAILAGMLCPPRWAVSGLVSQLVSHLVWDALSASLVLSFSCLWSCLPAFVFVLSRSLSFIWDAVSAPPGLVFFLSLVLSPSLSPIWSGMLCPPRWSCLSLVCGLVSGLVCHLGWDAVSASLGCLRSCLPACLPSALGCCVRLAGLVFLLSAVLSPVLSAILAGMLCPPRWGLVSQLVSHLVWDALSASLVLSFSCLWSCLPAFVLVLSRSLSFIWDAVSAPPGLVFFLSLVLSPACLGCCVRLLGSSPSPACLRSCGPSCFPAGLVCPCSGLVSKISCAICATVWGLRWCNFQMGWNHQLVMVSGEVGACQQLLSSPTLQVAKHADGAAQRLWGVGGGLQGWAYIPRCGKAL